MVRIWGNVFENHSLKKMSLDIFKLVATPYIFYAFARIFFTEIYSSVLTLNIIPFYFMVLIFFLVLELHYEMRLNEKLKDKLNFKEKLELREK